MSDAMPTPSPCPSGTLVRPIRLYNAIESAVAQSVSEGKGVSHLWTPAGLRFPEAQLREVLNALDAGQQVSTRIIFKQRHCTAEGQSQPEEIRTIAEVAISSKHSADGVQFHVGVVACHRADQGNAQ